MAVRQAIKHPVKHSYDDLQTDIEQFQSQYKERVHEQEKQIDKNIEQKEVREGERDVETFTRTAERIAKTAEYNVEAYALKGEAQEVVSSTKQAFHVMTQTASIIGGAAMAAVLGAEALKDEAQYTHQMKEIDKENQGLLNAASNQAFQEGLQGICSNLSEEDADKLMTFSQYSERDIRDINDRFEKDVTNGNQESFLSFMQSGGSVDQFCSEHNIQDVREKSALSDYSKYHNAANDYNGLSPFTKQAYETLKKSTDSTNGNFMETYGKNNKVQKNLRSQKDAFQVRTNDLAGQLSRYTDPSFRQLESKINQADREYKEQKRRIDMDSNLSDSQKRKMKKSIDKEWKKSTAKDRTILAQQRAKYDISQKEKGGTQNVINVSKALRAQKKDLERQLADATRAGDKSAVQKIQSQLNEIDALLTQSGALLRQQQDFQNIASKNKSDKSDAKNKKGRDAVSKERQAKREAQQTERKIISSGKRIIKKGINYGQSGNQVLSTYKKQTSQVKKVTSTMGGAVKLSTAAAGLVVTGMKTESNVIYKVVRKATGKKATGESSFSRVLGRVGRVTNETQRVTNSVMHPIRTAGQITRFGVTKGVVGIYHAAKRTAKLGKDGVRKGGAAIKKQYNKTKVSQRNRVRFKRAGASVKKVGSRIADSAVGRTVRKAAGFVRKVSSRAWYVVSKPFKGLRKIIGLIGGAIGSLFSLLGTFLLSIIGAFAFLLIFIIILVFALSALSSLLGAIAGFAGDILGIFTNSWVYVDEHPIQVEVAAEDYRNKELELLSFINDPGDLKVSVDPLNMESWTLDHTYTNYYSVGNVNKKAEAAIQAAGYFVSEDLVDLNGNSGANQDDESKVWNNSVGFYVDSYDSVSITYLDDNGKTSEYEISNAKDVLSMVDALYTEKGESFTFQEMYAYLGIWTEDFVSEEGGTVFADDVTDLFTMSHEITYNNGTSADDITYHEGIDKETLQSELCSNIAFVEAYSEDHSGIIMLPDLASDNTFFGSDYDGKVFLKVSMSGNSSMANAVEAVYRSIFLDYASQYKAQSTSFSEFLTTTFDQGIFVESNGTLAISDDCSDPFQYNQYDKEHVVYIEKTVDMPDSFNKTYGKKKHDGSGNNITTYFLFKASNSTYYVLDCDNDAGDSMFTLCGYYTPTQSLPSCLIVTSNDNGASFYYYDFTVYLVTSFSDGVDFHLALEESPTLSCKTFKSVLYTLETDDNGKDKLCAATDEDGNNISDEVSISSAVFNVCAGHLDLDATITVYLIGNENHNLFDLAMSMPSSDETGLYNVLNPLYYRLEGIDYSSGDFAYNPSEDWAVDSDFRSLATLKVDADLEYQMDCTSEEWDEMLNEAEEGNGDYMIEYDENGNAIFIPASGSTDSIAGLGALDDYWMRTADDGTILYDLFLNGNDYLVSYLVSGTQTELPLYVDVKGNATLYQKSSSYLDILSNGETLEVLVESE